MPTKSDSPKTETQVQEDESLPPPPSGDPEKAQKYLSSIIELIKKDKVEVSHSDLSKFDVSCMEDHYRVILKNYEIEVSHSKHPKTSDNIFIMLFNNLKKVGDAKSNRVILAYVHLTKEQYSQFKTASDDQIERKRKAEEEMRFLRAMMPIDQILKEYSEREKQNTPEYDESNSS